MKRAQRKMLDVLNTMGISEQLLRRAERRMKMDMDVYGAWPSSLWCCGSHGGLVVRYVRACVCVCE